MIVKANAERPAISSDGPDHCPGWIKREITGLVVRKESRRDGGFWFYVVGSDGRIWRASWDRVEVVDLALNCQECNGSGTISGDNGFPLPCSCQGALPRRPAMSPWVEGWAFRREVPGGE